jgi:hypothetical protein
MLRNGGFRLDRENYWKGRSKATQVDSCVNVHLDAEDTICPECEGYGRLPKGEITAFMMPQACDKCWGDKKFDWVERITGKATPEWAGQSTSCSSSSISQSSFTEDWETQKPFKKHLQDHIDKMAEQIRHSVDKDILEMLKNVFGTKYKKEVHF